MKTLIFIGSLLLSLTVFGSGIEPLPFKKLECVEQSQNVGAIRNVILSQIENSDQWTLEIYTQVVAPNAQPQLELLSTLTVAVMNGTQFFLQNRDENIQYNIFIDDLSTTYLYMNGEKQAEHFDCTP